MRKIHSFLIIICCLFCCNIAICASKPKVWIISDGCDKSLTLPNGKYVSDPDDISAIASYLLMSNHFDTRGIVIASNNNISKVKSGNQAEWAANYFGAAYEKDLKALNNEIGGYQSKIPFYESCLKNRDISFLKSNQYKSLKEYPSVKNLYSELCSVKDVINILCWGKLTEEAILVKHCITNNRYDLLKKMRFISHWTNSYLCVGTDEHPEHVHNAFNDVEASSYLKALALNGTIEFYECGSIGETGIVDGAPKGVSYYNQFYSSNLGKIYREGKYTTAKNCVDDSDAATFWALLGNWGVKLSEMNSNGINTKEIETQNRDNFALNSKRIHDELLRRSMVVSGASSDPVKVENIFPQHGLTDGHVYVDNGKVYLFGGHDKSWLTNNDWLMDCWEIWSTDNLRDWKYNSTIYPTDTYIGDLPNCWAGDICRSNNKYYWYFSNKSINIGVMVSDSITGGFKDAIGRPLLDSDIIKGSVYDPEVVYDNGKHYLIFGAGHYYIVELNDDMVSLKSKPLPVKIVDNKGAEVWTSDKSSMFIRNNKYYLVWGNKYAVADSLLGTYTYKGNFMNGGHTSIFNWYGQWYVVQENKDLGLFYRGLSLKPIYFDLNDNIIVPDDDYDYPGNSRKYNFESNEMGWHSIGGTSLEWVKQYNKPMIKGKINGDASIQSAYWLMNEVKNLSTFKIRIKNLCHAPKMKVYFATYNNVNKGKFWADSTINWSKASVIECDLKQINDYVEYTIPIKNIISGDRINAIRIDPAVGIEKGEWQINYISIE